MDYRFASVTLRDFLFISLLMSCALCQYKVVQVSEYCRHGARTTWTNNLHLDITEKFGTGILTPNGERMHFLLGQQIRKNYPELFGPDSDLKQDEIEVWASSVARTQLSAQSQLAGLFPEGTGLSITTPNNNKFFLPPFEGVDYKWPESDVGSLPFKFRSIPMTIPSKEFDFHYLSGYDTTCPNADLYSKKFDPEAHKKYEYLVNDVGKELEAKGFSPKKPYNIEKWNVNATALFSDEMITYLNYYNEYYPKMDARLMELIFRIHRVKFTCEFDDPKIIRLRSDRVARGILQGMEDYISGNSKKRFIFYSGHDTGVHSHIILSGLTNLQCMVDKAQGKSVTGNCEDIPDFAAQFLYELVIKDNSYFVRTLYNGKLFSFCDNAKEYCPFEEFKKAYAEKLFMDPEEFDKFCGNPYVENSKRGETIKYIQPISTLTVIVIGSVLVLIMLVLITLQMNKMKSQQKDPFKSFNEAESPYRKTNADSEYTPMEPPSAM